MQAAIILQGVRRPAFILATVVALLSRGPWNGHATQIYNMSFVHQLLFFQSCANNILNLLSGVEVRPKPSLVHTLVIKGQDGNEQLSFSSYTGLTN